MPASMELQSPRPPEPQPGDQTRPMLRLSGGRSSFIAPLATCFLAKPSHSQSRDLLESLYPPRRPRHSLLSLNLVALRVLDVQATRFRRFFRWIRILGSAEFALDFVRAAMRRGGRRDGAASRRRDCFAGDFFHGGNDFADAGAAAVPSCKSRWSQHQGRGYGLGQIDNVDVIADAVPSGVS